MVKMVNDGKPKLDQSVSAWNMGLVVGLVTQLVLTNTQHYQHRSIYRQVGY